MRGPVALAVTGLALALLTGCVPGDPVPKPTFAAEPVRHEPVVPLSDDGVLAYCPAVPAEHFEGYTDIQSVYICRADEHRATDGVSTYGPWQSVYRVPDPQALLALYAGPSDTRVVTGCPPGNPDPLIIWVHGAGTVRAVYAPVNGCGFPLGAVEDAYQKAERELVLEADTGAPLDAHDTPAEH
jgi:hypothetical protein